MRVMSELIQLDMGMSTNLYFPAMGTAGLLRLAVRGNNLVPAPPPNITATVECGIVCFFCNELNRYRGIAIWNIDSLR